MKKDNVTIIGPAIVDILAGPIDKTLFTLGSIPMDEIKMSFGGNAYNEACVLSRFGVDVDLISKVGNDEAGNRVVQKIRSLGISTEHVKVENELSTSINIVLFDSQGERRFLTNPKSSQRVLSEKDISDAVADFASIVCFSCMFISPLLDIPSMERLFRKIKETKQRVLIVDMTKAKNGETIQDLKPLLPYVDYLLPNEEEINMLGSGSVEESAKELLHLGAGCIIVKRGKNGCTVFTRENTISVTAFHTDCAVATTGAGDSFAAGFIYGLLNGNTLIECAQFANATASCCVEHVGAADGILSIEEPMRRYEILRNSVRGEQNGGK